MKTKKRFLSLLLTVAMVVTLMPAATFITQAKSDYPVSSIADLKSYLESDGAVCAVLKKDLKGHADGDYAYWCTIKGTKWIDLNGHKLDISNDNKRSYSTLFNVPEEADLTVYDSQMSGNGKVHFDGYLNENGDFRNRSLFNVSGDLTVTGITLEAGRSKSYYSAKYARTVYKQIFGDAIQARNGSRVVVTDCILYGRGSNDTRLDFRNAGIDAAGGSTVYFNAGEIRAKGGANCFNIAGSATVKVLSGEFSCETLGAIQVSGSTTAGLSKGRVGVSYSHIGDYVAVTERSSYSGELKEVSSLKVKPNGQGDGRFTAKSGDTVQENGNTVHRLLSSQPQAALDIFLNCYQGRFYYDVDPFTFGAKYSRDYIMKVYRDGKLLKSKGPFSTSQRTFDMNEVIDGFTPEKGVTYSLVCEFDQVLNDKVHATGRSAPFYFKIVDDLTAPKLTAQSPSNTTYNKGDTKSLFVTAEGTNLSYVWQYFNGTNWSQIMSETDRTLELKDLDESYDGRTYRCAVKNSAGITWSQEMKLNMIKDISRVDIQLDKPRHGVPLDQTAETTTPGVKVVKVEWEKVRAGKVSDGFTPYTGLRMEAIVTVEAADGMRFSDTGVTGYIGTQKSYITSNPTTTQKGLHFSFDTLPPTSGSVGIGTVFLEVQEPAAGDTLHDLKIVDGGAYSSAYDRDVRCGTTGTTWYCDGVKANFSDVVQAGKTYTVETTLVPNTGWAFTAASSAEVNGEPMESEPEGANLKVRRDFTILDDGSVEPPDDGNPFVDVSSDDYFYEPVLWAVEHGITNGTDATHFSPEATCTRGQVVTFLWRANGSPEPGSSVNPFNDVSSSDYYYKAVLWAVKNGITNGTSDTTFSPDQGCTRGQVVTFMNRAGGSPKADAANPFVDVFPSDYYYDAVLWAVKYGITNGTDATHFSPNATCTRGQIVTFLYRAPKG